MARVEGQKELIETALYDEFTFVVATTYTQISLFTIPRGAAGKTYANTNLTGPGGFLTGIKSMTIRSLALIPESPMTTANLRGMLNGWGALMIEDKPYPQPFNLKLLAGGPQMIQHMADLNAGAAATVLNAHVGDGRINNVLSFTRPYLITIAPNENFYVTLNWDVPGAPFIPAGVNERMLFVLYGRYARSVV